MVAGKTVAILAVAALCTAAVVGGAIAAFTAMYQQTGNTVDVDSTYYTVGLYNGDSLIGSEQKIDITIQANTTTSRGSTTYQWIDTTDNAFTGYVIKVKDQSGNVAAISGNVTFKLTDIGSALSIGNFKLNNSAIGGNGNQIAITDGVSAALTLSYTYPAGSGNAPSITENNTFGIQIEFETETAPTSSS